MPKKPLYPHVPKAAIMPETRPTDTGPKKQWLEEFETEIKDMQGKVARLSRITRETMPEETRLGIFMGQMALPMKDALKEIEAVKRKTGAR